MINGNSAKYCIRMAAMIVVILAVFARTFIPTGFMPSTDGGAAFAMVICSGSGTQTIMVDKSGQPVPDNQNHNQKNAQEHCPYAQTLSGNPLLPSTIAVIIPFKETIFHLWTDRVHHRHAVAWASSRAPPFLV